MKKQNNDSEWLDYMVPIRFVGMSWAMILVIYFLPATWWGISLMAVLGFGILGVVMASFNDMWSDYASLGAFAVLNGIYFAALLWFHDSSWVFYAAIILIFLSFSTQFNHIRKSRHT